MKICTAILLACLCACLDAPNKAVPTHGNEPPTSIQANHVPVENPEGTTIAARFAPTSGYKRRDIEENTFAHFLRHFPLKPFGTPVFFHNGKQKPNQSAHAAVLDIETGERDLQQCADAVMRLRAEYLFSQKKFEDIRFRFGNGFEADYKTWRSGHRIAVNGNSVKWVESSSASASYQSFRKYLDMVFAYSGTQSLMRDMHPAPVEDMQIGDVFVQGGNPGHAVIVVDMAFDPGTGKKQFMLAQSYMPAQDIHILKNPTAEKTTPWYDLDFGPVLVTPEWRFEKSDMRRF